MENSQVHWAGFDHFQRNQWLGYSLSHALPFVSIAALTMSIVQLEAGETGTCFSNTSEIEEARVNMPRRNDSLEPILPATYRKGAPLRPRPYSDPFISLMEDSFFLNEYRHSIM